MNNHTEIIPDATPEMKTLFETVKKVSFSTAEKNKQRETLRLYMHTPIPAFIQDDPFNKDTNNSVNYPVLSPFFPQVNFFHSLLTQTRFITFALALVLVVGTGTAFASKNALPGDPLYRVKLNVTEKAETLLSFGSQSQAEIALLHATTRLEEVETLTAQGKLNIRTSTIITKELQPNFKTQADSVTANVANLQSKGQAVVAAEIASNFESFLSSHQVVLVELTQHQENAPIHPSTHTFLRAQSQNEIYNKTQNGVRAGTQNTIQQDTSSLVVASTSVTSTSVSVEVLSSLTGEVGTHLLTTANARASAEGVVAISTDQNKIKESSETALVVSIQKINLASSAVAHAISTIRSTTASSTESEQSISVAQSRISSAKEDVSAGQTYIQTGEYGQAFLLFKKASRTADEVKITLEAIDGIKNIEKKNSKANTGDVPKEDKNLNLNLNTATTTGTSETATTTAIESDPAHSSLITSEPTMIVATSTAVENLNTDSFR